MPGARTNNSCGALSHSDFFHDQPVQRLQSLEGEVGDDYLHNVVWEYGWRRPGRADRFERGMRFWRRATVER